MVKCVHNEMKEGKNEENIRDNENNSIRNSYISSSSS